ncbi:cell envelope-related transcriptional attenuator [Lachnospiraceae bacterium KM106-2]|nr:cell envelope-related transcriptional attenuator [Lachnospiraceae bacterium KM106-2]
MEVKLNNTLNIVTRDTVNDLSNVDLNDVDVVSDDQIINILLIGSDKRENWTQAGRSDSVMIATLDAKNKKLKLTSLMRDMYVDIPGYEKNRFNAAYSFGGVSLLYQTIATNFGIKLDGYVLVDFDAFKKVIKQLGGVKITLTDAEWKYLTTAYKKGSVTKLKQGTNLMNGAQALAYTRIRQDKAGDFGRTQRQRVVLQSIFEKAKTLSLNESLELAREVLSYISTDLTNDEIYSYIKTVLLMGTTDIDQFRIPVDNSYQSQRISGMSVLIPDLEVNKQELQNFIFSN